MVASPAVPHHKPLYVFLSLIFFSLLIVIFTWFVYFFKNTLTVLKHLILIRDKA